MSDPRTAELADGLRQVRERIARAADAAGRDADEITLVVVTKTHPASDVVRLAELGVTDVGENRHPEAGRKRDEAGESAARLRWHFVGSLQTNKASSVARYADAVHSVDRTRLVTALSNGAERAGRELDVLIQVNLEGYDDDPVGRAGVAPAAAVDLAGSVDSATSLRLAGVMMVAPLRADPDDAFARLADVAAQVRAAYPSAVAISAGMSGDLEQAVKHGATHVRIGRSVLGERPPLG